MVLLRSIAELASVPGPVVLAIGVFDGLHLGHRAVLERARSEAVSRGGTALALSFDPHPARILRPELAPRLLTATEHKLRLLEELGFTHTLLLSFDQELAAMDADDFIRSLAHHAQPLAAICVGHQWSFGKGRKGNLERLALLGSALQFDEIGVEEVQIAGTPVSSTRIRNALLAGDLSLASHLLGRPYTVLGKVQHGRELGRTLGFPTANMSLLSEQLPPNGVYAVRVTQPDDGFPQFSHWAGVANLGTRPTVSSDSGESTPRSEPILEVHLLEFTGDLYGRTLEVEFVEFLRPEQRFDSLDLLRAQIGADAREAARLLTPV
jgi:riboflavin kinase/FMN adenylyltransferase